MLPSTLRSALEHGRPNCTNSPCQAQSLHQQRKQKGYLHLYTYSKRAQCQRIGVDSKRRHRAGQANKSSTGDKSFLRTKIQHTDTEGLRQEETQLNGNNRYVHENLACAPKGEGGIAKLIIQPKSTKLRRAPPIRRLAGPQLKVLNVSIARTASPRIPRGNMQNADERFHVQRGACISIACSTARCVF